VCTDLLLATKRKSEPHTIELVEKNGFFVALFFNFTPEYVQWKHLCKRFCFRSLSTINLLEILFTTSSCNKNRAEHVTTQMECKRNGGSGGDPSHSQGGAGCRGTEPGGGGGPISAALLPGTSGGHAHSMHHDLELLSLESGEWCG
jgi:hypothetical protein